MCRGAVQPAQLRRFSEGKERITSRPNPGTHRTCWQFRGRKNATQPQRLWIAKAHDPKVAHRSENPPEQRSVITPLDSPASIIVRDWNIRTRVHENGTRASAARSGGKYFNQTDPKTSHENNSPSAPLKHPIHRCADPAREQSSAQERPTASLIRAVPGLGAFSAGSWSVWD